jgi:acylphosphatase
MLARIALVSDRTTEIVRRRVVVHGIVQGVWFRDSTRQQARRLGVGGWVRNRPDGTVEAVFEGHPIAVEQLVSFTRSGPPGAHVTRLDVCEEVPEGLTGFEVR